MKRFRIFVLLICAISLLLTAGCKTEMDADGKAAQATKTALAEAWRQIGMPNITNFQQLKMMKWIYELTDDAKLVTYTYIKADYSGKLIFLGKSMGYGVPFSAQFTNPEKVVEGDKQLGYDLTGHINYPMKLPQADPNGLYMPTSSSATWVIFINPINGKPEPVYIEPEIIISPFPMSKFLPGVVVGDESLWGKE